MPLNSALTISTTMANVDGQIFWSRPRSFVLALILEIARLGDDH